MKYDFTTLPNRKNTGSIKWAAMEEQGFALPSDCIPLSVADMELKIAPEIVEGLQRYIADVVPGYTKPTSSYWETVQHWMKERHDFSFDASHGVLTPGVVTALFASVRAMSAPGDGVILFTPVYGPFYRAVLENDRVVASCPLQNDDGYYTIDFAHFEEIAKDPNNKLLLLCSPHNPAGRVWTKEELARIASICEENDIFVVADEIHQDIVFPGYVHTVYHNVSEAAKQHSILCTSASKTFNIAGLQCSNIIIPNDDARARFEKELGGLALHGANSLGMEATRLGYEKGGAWLEEFLVHVKENEKMVIDFFEKHALPLRARPLEGTYLLWVDVRGLGVAQKELVEYCAKACHFVPTDGTIFGEEGEGYLRINLACPRETLHKTLVYFFEDRSR